MSAGNECCYCDAEREDRLITENDDGKDGVECCLCGWWACGECAEGNGWDACDDNGDQWCDECKEET